MTEHSLVAPKDPVAIESHIEFLRCVVGDCPVVYVSVPISTGRRFVEWYRREGRKLDEQYGRNSEPYRRAHRRRVIEPNTDDANCFVAQLRSRTSDYVIDPSALERPDWSQDDYRYFWGKVIDRFAGRHVLMDGWHYSEGCVFEFMSSSRQRLVVVDQDEKPVALPDGVALIDEAIEVLSEFGMSTDFHKAVRRELTAEVVRLGVEVQVEERTVRHALLRMSAANKGGRFKDEILDALAAVGNVAQFVSFANTSDLKRRFSRVIGFEPNEPFDSPEQAVEELLKRSPDGMVNVRSFRPEKPKGEPLIYGLRTVDEVINVLREKASEGKFAIANETVDIHDGGISGVSIGSVIEFAPDDSPQCVERPGVCSLSRDLALDVIERVYGFRPAINLPLDVRVEFSIHPCKRGLRGDHTIIWELEDVGSVMVEARMHWPNQFSRFIGDKAFGLLIADSIGLSVPRTTVLTRRLSPFAFGRETGTLESWMRTCPAVSVPGKYPTTFGWTNPYGLLAKDATQTSNSQNSEWLASVLAQEAVTPKFSGSLVPQADGQPRIEGVAGRGSEFMLGQTPEDLPDRVTKSVEHVYEKAAARLGPVQMEWVYDGQTAWTIQLHLSSVLTTGDVIYPGDPLSYRPFDVRLGLEALRELLPEVNTAREGITLVGDVGISSHFGDVLRREKVPSKIDRDSKDVCPARSVRK